MIVSGSEVGLAGREMNPSKREYSDGPETYIDHHLILPLLSDVDPSLHLRPDYQLDLGLELVLSLRVMIFSVPVLQSLPGPNVVLISVGLYRILGPGLRVRL